jgi:RHS repeat-associated protein
MQRRLRVFLVLGATLLAAGCKPDAGLDSESLDAAVAVISNALSDPPDPQCAVATYEGHEYWFCRQLRSWSAARTRCQSETGMDLARIDTPGENAFIFANTPVDAWIGASDTTTEGAWRWSNNNEQFWSGGSGGGTIGGRYANWKSAQPDNFFNQDCAAMELFASGKWADRACTETLEFVCERTLDVGEPGVDCALEGTLEDAPWPGFRRCPTHQGVSPLIGAQDAEPYLTYETDGDVESSPAIAEDGTIYVGSYDGYLYAFSPSLALLWRYQTGGLIRSSPAIGPDGTIHVGSNDGKVYAINPNGTLKWSYQTLSPVRSSPAVGSDGRVYVGSDNSRFYALSSTGTMLWNIDTLAAVRSSAAISPDGTVYIGFEDWQVVALNSNGTEKWSYPTLGPVTSSPAIGPDGTVYVGCFDGYLYAIHPGSGTLKWSYNVGYPITSSPAVASNGVIVFGSDDMFVRALNPSGGLEWEYETGDIIISSPAIGSDGIVYVGSRDVFIYALELADGDVVWTLGTDGEVESSPAIGADGKIYVGSDDDKLYAIGPGCSPSNPCDNGEGPCGDNADCIAGLTCGFGIGPRYGLPEDMGVCWNPDLCATLAPADCGSPGSLCGDCCVPECGATGGADNTCGADCPDCVVGADTDADGIDDCTERSDDDPWTDAWVFNGVNAERGDSCHGSPTCGAIDTQAEIIACFVPEESNHLTSGWDFATTDTDVCEPGFDYTPSWDGCGEDFAARYSATMRLEQSGFYCFAVNGGTTSQCGALFVENTSTVSGGSPICLELAGGFYPIEWFYETTSSGTNELHIDFCFGDTTTCTPTSSIPPEILRDPDDTDERLCDDGDCSEACPCGPGGVVTSGLECLPELVVRTDRADRFGLSSSTTPVCWDPLCDDPESELFECGTVTSRCGLCPSCTTNCVGLACGPDSCWGECGDGICEDGEAGCVTHADCATGLRCIPSDSGPGICRPAHCDSAGRNPCSDVANAGDMTECGVCPECSDPCGSRTCGENACGESCGTPGPGEFCDDGMIAGTTANIVDVPADYYSEDGPTTVGTMADSLSVTPFGQAAYSIPIQLPPGRNGAQPNLAFSYSSASGDGYLGLGWGITGLSAIHRCPKTIAQDGVVAPVTYSEDDRFCLDGNRLVLENPSDTYGEDGTEYRTEHETFTKVIIETNETLGPIGFTAYSADGLILTYDKRIGGGIAIGENEAREPNFDTTALAGTTMTQTWALTEVEDRFGNSVEIDYWEPRHCIASHGDCHLIGVTAREYYPKKIRYTDHASSNADRVVEFFYEPRVSPIASYQHGQRYERNYLMTKIEARVLSLPAASQTAFSYEMVYAQPSAGPEDENWATELHKPTTLTSIRQCARASLDPAVSSMTCKPLTSFEYETVERGLAARADDHFVEYQAADAEFVGGSLVLDLDGNGQDDILHSMCLDYDQGVCIALRWWMVLNSSYMESSGAYQDFARLTVRRNVAAGNGKIQQFRSVISPGAVYVVDVNQDGTDEVLEIGAEARIWRYFDGKLRVGVVTPSLGNLSNAEVFVLDANGDGRSDIVTCTSHPRGDSFEYHWGLRLGDGVSWEPLTGITESGPACAGGQAIDLNGDGAQEILLATTRFKTSGGLRYSPQRTVADQRGSKLFWPMSGETSSGILPARAIQTERLVFDATGDGLADAIDFDAQFGIELWAGTGNGFVSLGRSTISLDGVDSAFNAADFLNNLTGNALPFDENGDGRMDLIALGSPTRWVLLRSTGTGFVRRDLGNVGAPTQTRNLVAYDENNDGQKDLWQSDSIYRRQGASGARLRVITDGLKARTKIDYISLIADEASEDILDQIYGIQYNTEECNYPCYRRIPRDSVVRHVHTWDYLYEPATTTECDDPDPPAACDPPPTRSLWYAYARAASDLNGRGTLGFGATLTIDLARSEIAAETEDGLYLRQTIYLNASDNETLNTYPYLGIPQTEIETVTTASGRQRTSRKTRVFEPTLPGSTRTFGHVKSETELVTEGDSPGDDEPDELRHVVRSWEYHEVYGNVTVAKTDWQLGIGTDEDVITTEYLLDQDHVDAWMIRQPSVRTYEHNRNIDDAIRVETYKYCETEPTLGCTPFTGKPTFVTVAPESDPTLARTTEVTYDVFGNPVVQSTTGLTIDGPDERTTSAIYDDLGLFPIQVFDDNAIATNVQYDLALGVPIASEALGRPGETVKTFKTTDGFGRLRRVVDAAEDTTATEFDTRPEGGMEIITTRSGAPTQTIELDVLGREARSTIDGFSDELIRTTAYNAMGLVAQQSRWHADGPSVTPDVSSVSYDALGRIVSIEQPDETEARLCYMNSVACIRNPRGFTSCSVRNEHGDLAHSTDPDDDDTLSCEEVLGEVVVDFPANDEPVESPRYKANSFEYGPMGHIASIYDPRRNEIRFERDDFGQVLEHHDPDKGTVASTYNAFGEVMTSLSELGVLSEFDYDGLGRLVLRNDEPAPGDSNPAQETLFQYDYIAVPPIAFIGFYGRLFGTANDEGTVTTQLYDEAGREVAFLRAIETASGTETLTRATSYDLNGRLDTVSYASENDPESLAYRHHYNANGHLERVSRPSDNALIWEAIAVDDYGQLQLEELGNGVEITRSYEAFTGRISGLKSETSSTVIQDWTYGYYNNGNLHTRIDARTGEATIYTLDELDRLKRALTNDGPTDVYDEQYTYDELGNITTKIISEAGASADVWAYEYHLPPQGRQRRLQSVTLNGGSSQDYYYNDDGSLDFRDGSWQSSLQTYYSRQGMPVGMGTSLNGSASTTIGYDAFNTRVRKTDSDGEILYLDDAFTRSTSTSTTGYTERLVIAGGSGPVAEIVRDPTGTDTISYVHTDPLGTIEVITDDDGDLVERRTYEAFGKRRDVTGTSPYGSRGDYTGHELDGSFGLVNMKARLYDPELGRFIAPDPIIADPKSTQGINPYSYVRNNPATLVDPFGLQECLPNDPACQPDQGAPGEPGDPVCAVGCSDIDWDATGKWFAENWEILEDYGVWKDIGGFFSGLFDSAPPSTEGANSNTSEHSSSVAPGAMGHQGLHESLHHPNFKVVDTSQTYIIAFEVATSFAPGGVLDDIARGGFNYLKLTKNGDELIDLYRFVSPAEFDDIARTGVFRFGPGMEAKQFGFQLDEVLRLSDHFTDAAAIVRARVPRSILQGLDQTPVDTFILRSGTVTARGPQQLRLLNESLVGPVEHVF